MAIKSRGIKKQTKQDGDYDTLEDGDYEARLAYVADLGLQEKYKAEEGDDPVQQLALGMEIVGEHVQIGGVKVPRLIWGAPFNTFGIVT